MGKGEYIWMHMYQHLTTYSCKNEENVSKSQNLKMNMDGTDEKEG